MTAAVIGTGKISQEHLRFLAGSPDARLLAVCDLSPALAAFAAETCADTKAYSDYRAMLADLRPQVVHVLTPPHTHSAIVEDAIGIGAHVICEKPLATSRSELQRLWAMARSRGVWLIENHNYRFNAPVLTLERWVSHGLLGEVREVDVRMALDIRSPGGRYADENLPHPSHRLPAGVVHEFVTHLCYLLQRFMPQFDRVSAAWNNYGGGMLFKYDDLDALVFGDGVHGRVRFTARTWPDSFTVTVRGSGATAHADLFQPLATLTRPRGGPKAIAPLINQYDEGRTIKRAARRNFIDKVMQRTAYEGLHTFLTRIYSALNRGEEPPVTFDDMDSAARLIDAMLQESNRA